MPRWLYPRVPRDTTPATLMQIIEIANADRPILRPNDPIWKFDPIEAGKKQVNEWLYRESSDIYPTIQSRVYPSILTHAATLGEFHIGQPRAETVARAMKLIKQIQTICPGAEIDECYEY